MPVIPTSRTRLLVEATPDAFAADAVTEVAMADGTLFRTEPSGRVRGRAASETFREFITKARL
jgi:hypothetical protein